MTVVTLSGKIRNARRKMKEKYIGKNLRARACFSIENIKTSDV
jgi:hypothetical protein